MLRIKLINYFVSKRKRLYVVHTNRYINSLKKQPKSFFNSKKLINYLLKIWFIDFVWHCTDTIYCIFIVLFEFNNLSYMEI